MNVAIHTEDLTKQYGAHRGVERLSLDVRAGEVFSFLGPNGAGKTTTIRLLLDFLRPTRGRATILGMDSRAQSVAIHRRIGYLPGELALYDRMTGRDLLAYFAHLRGGVDRRYTSALAERLAVDLARPIRTLSKGNKQKIGLIQAFMSRPELLVLDEPTDGLDPLVQQEFHRMVAEVKAEGRTVFLSSHVLGEVERIADRVGIIRDGRLIVVEEIHALKARAVRQMEILFAAPVPREPFQTLPGVRDLHLDGAALRCTVTGVVDPLIKAAARFTVESVTSREPDLEEIFLTYYDEGVRDAA